MGRTWFVFLVLALVGGFAALNWGEFTRKSALSLGLTRVEAPLGVILLSLIVLLSLLYLLFTIGLETAALLEVKRYAREMLQYKKLAEDAEASRYTELKRFLEAELKRLEEAEKEEIQALALRVEEVLEKHGNTLAAYIGELEDTLLTLLRKTPGDDPGAKN
ncbi:MAG: DNA cytosine methyltransferase [Thermaceae bacterium]